MWLCAQERRLHARPPLPLARRALRVFDVNRPGRDCKTIVTQAKRKEGSIPGGGLPPGGGGAWPRCSSRLPA